MSSRSFDSMALPSSTLSALKLAGYESPRDMQATSAQDLARDLGISLTDAETIYTASHRRSSTLTQSAASMVKDRQQISTKCPAVDQLLSGGLPRGHILEISGPPGTPKEVLAVNIARSFVEAGEEVIFIDSQNMTCPARLDQLLRVSSSLPADYSRLVYHMSIQALPELIVFLHNLPSQLDSHTKVKLLILNSISFPFQVSQNCSASARAALLDRMKEMLTVASVSRNLTVVTTSQLTTKFLHPDGTFGRLGAGAVGVMVPQLGTAYLPAGRSHRIIIAPQSTTSGFIKLLSSPTYQPGSTLPPTVPYQTVRE